jgi:hypothetical protein
VTQPEVPEATERRIDIGDSHVLVLITPPGATEPTGVEVEHLTPAGKRCMGWISLDVARNADLPEARKWQVQSWDPLTLSPSLLCGCGDHGFVRGWRWIPA